MATKLGPDHYRYSAVLEPSGVQITTDRYVVCGETPKCWYIIHESWAGYAGGESEWQQSWVKKFRKRVLKQQDHGRRFAYTDKRLAMFSLKKRLEFKLARMRSETSIATLALAQASSLHDSSLQDFPVTIPCGHDDYTASLNYSEW